jgi:3-phosphoshikimate 1-carboxyvinyltransferase
MKTLTIQPGRSLRGRVSVPGDKSITHRAIMLSALADGVTRIGGFCRGEDCLNTMGAFQAMGITIEESPEWLTVHGKGQWGLSEPEGPIDCGNSGTGIRLLAGILAGQDFFSVLTGDDSIRRRPMGRVIRPLRQMGATIAGRKGGELAPLAITGTRLHGVDIASPVASAQLKSAVLLAGLFAEGVTRVIEPRPSRDHTERLLRYFGIPVRMEDGTIVLEGRPSLGWPGKEKLMVPGDLSAAAFFLVGASIVPGSDVTIEAVGINPTRTGVLEVLMEMGADITVVDRREQTGEPVADLAVRSASLRGLSIGPDRIPQTIDEFPVLCVAAALAEGTTTISGAEELRVKESDRITTMATELRKMGVTVRERPDGLVIEGLGARTGGKTPLRGATCSSYGDHRVAMSLAIAGLIADRPTMIEGADCIETSFPDFELKLLKLSTDASRGL